jgi:fluoride ion exporter CrcB/FEX
MFSEKSEKWLLLVSGTIGALGGVVGALVDFFAKIDALKNLPSGVSWVAYAGLFLIGLWLLIKWRTRHSRLLKPDALRLDWRGCV